MRSLIVAKIILILIIAKSRLQKVCIFSFFAHFKAFVVAFDKNRSNFALMKIHIFNPEHDTALASNKAPFTPPHAARQLHHDLGFIAATWAGDGDFVIVDDKVMAKESLKRIGFENLTCKLVEPTEIKKLGTSDLKEICVWGWDKAIKRYLFDLGLKCETMMPTESILDELRNISGREWAANNILQPLVTDSNHLIGEAFVAKSVAEAININNYPAWVLKAPWSCSGRGVRYVSKNTLSPHLEGWVANTIAKQGYIMIEPFYTKILDLAGEFYCCKDGNVKFLGLSLFETKNGTYTGNIIAPENRKRKVVSKYIPLSILDDAIAKIAVLASKGFKGIYEGHFGVDMMIVADKDRGFCLHPCVELNLRRTMGYVALCMKSANNLPTKVMRTSMDKKYRLRITESEDDIWK